MGAADEQQEFSDEQRQMIQLVYLSCSGISFCGSLLVVFSYYKFKPLRNFVFTLVMMLAVSDLGSGLAWYIGVSSAPGSIRCFLQGSLLQLFLLSSILWTTAIAYVLRRNILAKYRVEQPSLWNLCLYSWGMAFALMILPLTTNTYTKPIGSHEWCWIDTTDKTEFDSGTVWRFVSFFVPLGVALCFNLHVYILILGRKKREIRRTSSTDDKAQRAMERRIKQLQRYPIVLIACWTFGTINRVQNAINPRHPIFALWCCHAATSSLMGFGNATVYGLTDKVKSAWRNYLLEGGREELSHPGVELTEIKRSNPSSDGSSQATQVTTVRRPSLTTAHGTAARGTTVAL